jgi:hypothetical protein
MNTWLSGMSPGSTISGAFGSTPPGRVVVADAVVEEVGSVTTVVADEDAATLTVVDGGEEPRELLHPAARSAAADANAAIVHVVRIVQSCPSDHR